MIREEIFIYKAKCYYGAFNGSVGVYADIDPDNINHVVIRGLCKMMVSIWERWQADTRHYYVSKKRYKEYCDVIERAKGLIDNSYKSYDKAVEAVEDAEKWINHVVVPRVRGGCSRVM